MVDLKGPTPEEMKPGETYKVVESESGTFELQKVAEESPQKDAHGAYHRMPKDKEHIVAAPLELEFDLDVYSLLNWISRQCDISMDRLCGQLVEEGAHKLLDNYSELGKLMSESLKRDHSLHRWIRKDEW
jgi:hypothetical protein